MTGKTKRLMYRDTKGKWHWVELPYLDDRQFKAASEEWLTNNVGVTE